MLNLKNLLIHARWGNQLTLNDISLANEMTLVEVFKSSYLLPKTKRVTCDSQMRRR